MDQYLNWKLDLHSCGHHLSETLETSMRDYVGAFQTCQACAALQRDQEKQAKKDEQLRDQKTFVPDSARLWQVWTLADAKAKAQEQQK